MESAAAALCFHCGEPVGPGARFSALVDGGERPMCCAGCAAVARTIAAAGLSGYYANRSAVALRESSRASPGEFADYDLAEVQRPFVRRAADGFAEATLLVEGITCGACAWVIERGAGRLDGVRSIAVNVAARRVQVAWDDSRTKLSALLAAIAALGYRTRGFDAAVAERAAARERRAMLWRLFVAGFAMMQVMMYAAPAYVTDGELTREAASLMRWASLVLTLPVMIWSAGPFFGNALRDLEHGRAGMDVPVALGLAVAFGASLEATLAGSGDVYFDSISMFVFLLLGGRFLEALARERATESQRRLAGHAPAVADRLVPGSPAQATERVAAAALVAGDLVLVAPGAAIPADGVLADGTGVADESLLTGEARHVAKRAGDAVIGGSINLEQRIVVRVTHTGPQTVLAGVLRLLDRAQAGRPRIALVADRVAQWFVAALLLLALAAGLAWWPIDSRRALEVVVAVLVVSCPCALSLATPAALAAATGALHRRGVLVTRGDALETLARVTHVVLDKTGTLTVGRPVLTGIVPLADLDRESCLALAAALEHGSEHPIARSIVAAAGVARAGVAQGLHNFPGRGIEAVVNGTRYRIGSTHFAAGLARRPVAEALAMTADDATIAVLAGEAGYIALFVLADAPRAGARELVQALDARGKQVSLLSGDRQSAVARMADELGIASAVGAADPAAKVDFVTGLQARGGVVAMVGDGVNDAPVLARAQVAIGMGSGTDLARSCAALVLPGNDVTRLLDAFDIAARAMRIVRQNFAWAVTYNVIMLPLAIAGWLTPLAAGAGMAGSSLVVVLNALRLAQWKSSTS